MKVFEKIQSFVDSLGEYIKNFSNLFLIFVGAFALLTVVIIFITSFAYECKLTKTVDKINKFLERNPKINDDNLITFNNLLKAKSVPKALRRQWQQFMLYREHPASYYMSFKHCVENPLRNSTYQQQMTVYKVVSYVLVVLSFIVSIFMAQQSYYSSVVWREIVVIPLVILVCYWLISMILNLVHNAISGDLFQNYQYFEINMDKAMLTLPEFVDYEVLFSQDEIRRGIPVLFAYLQKRAIQEQQELEKARLKSVDHEKFDFDKAGLDGSLVLERAMRETENFAAQRKKYLQEIERVNNEISVMENNYKEQTKEFQRQVQTSKETVENLKEQLEQATSTIEINYIKKQMRDELTRQQLAEKDFDILTDKHNQTIKSLNQEIKGYYDEIKSAKQGLETAMLSEFNTYSIKVYDNIEKIVDEKMQGKVDDFKGQIRGLETELEEKNEELENVYVRYQEVLSQVPADGQGQVQYADDPVLDKKSKKKKKNDDTGMIQPGLEQDSFNQYDYAQPEAQDQQYYDNQDYQQYDYQDGQYADYQNDQYDNYQYDQYNDMDYQNNDAQYTEQYNDQFAGQYDEQYVATQDFNEEFNPQYSEDYAAGDTYVPLDDNQNYADQGYGNQDNFAQEGSAYDYVPLADENQNIEDNYGGYVPLADEQQSYGEYVPMAEEKNVTESVPAKEEPAQQPKVEEDMFDEKDFDIDFNQSNAKKDSLNDMLFDFDFGDAVEDESKASDSKAEEDDIDLNDLFGFYEDKKEQASKKVEEPKAVKVEEPVIEDLDEEDYDDEDDDGDEEVIALPKRKAGRPRKVVDESEIKPKRSVGRPRKTVETKEVAPKRSVGRPRKTAVQVEVEEVEEAPKRKVGRPKKTTTTEKTTTVKRSVGRPKKNSTEVEEVLEAPKRSVGRPKKIVVKVEVSPNQTETKPKRGRPRKN